MTLNPQDFRLRMVWSIDGLSKMVAEFSHSNWLPRIGESLVLPVDEAGKHNSCRTWHKFKVLDIIYDFQNQIVRVLCSPVSGLMPPSSGSFAREAMLRLQELEDKQKAEAIKRQAQLERELSQLTEEDIDEELARLKRKVLE